MSVCEGFASFSVNIISYFVAYVNDCSFIFLLNKEQTYRSPTGLCRFGFVLPVCVFAGFDESGAERRG